MKNKSKIRVDGITLIALVITIIILLIISASILQLILGENGIINLAKLAGRNYIDAETEKKED